MTKRDFLTLALTVAVGVAFSSDAMAQFNSKKLRDAIKKAGKKAPAADRDDDGDDEEGDDVKKVTYEPVKSSSEQRKLLARASEANETKYNPVRNSFEQGSDGSFRFKVEETDKKTRKKTEKLLTFDEEGAIVVPKVTYREAKDAKEAYALVKIAAKANRARYSPQRGTMEVGSDGSFRFVDSKKKERLTFNADGTPRVEEEKPEEDGDGKEEEDSKDSKKPTIKKRR